MDEAAARRVGCQLASVMEESGREYQVWIEAGATGAENEAVDDETRALLAETGIKAGIALPIFARGQLIGCIVAISSHPERLRPAVKGIRFIAAPIVIALANVRRFASLGEQRAEIEQLVAQLRERTGALEEANIELQRVARYRSLFLARMSHELRTPLTAILGFSELLLDYENLTPPQHLYCEKIQDSGFKLQTSVKQLVDLSRLEAGQAELFLHEFSVREMLRETCAAVERLAQKKEVKLDCHTAPGCSTIVSDEGKLRQVLYNFFAHAIGRSPEEGIVSVKAFMRQPAELCIEISDTGKPLADAAHLFEPIDIDAPNERGTNMNELGLVIAHRLVAVLGGKIVLNTDAPPFDRLASGGRLDTRRIRCG
jgi:signal transduction histidine kinase